MSVESSAGSPVVDETTSVRRYERLFIGGEWVPMPSGRVITSVDPATEEVWAEVPEADEETVDAAVQAASTAMDGPWSRLAPAQRGALLLRLAELLRRDAARIAEVESHDNGKPFRDTQNEMQRSADWITFFAGVADKIRGSQVPVGPDMHAYTRREPVGVVGAILPWNSPMLLTCWKLAPALAAGNTTVLKPASMTPTSTLELARLVEEAGFPPGVVNVVLGSGASVGTALVSHPKVNKISFTGEYSTAQGIIASGGGLKRYTFECGGKSPYIVFADADIERALRVGLQSSFRSTGQSCSLASRVFVERPIYEKFAQAMAERSKRIRVGMPFDPSTHIGPQSSARQLDKSQSYIKLAREAGFRLLAGGERPEGFPRGYFIEPTIFADVDPASRLAQEEIFGPVLAIMPFDDEDEVVEMANSTQYGLVGGLFTSDVGRAHRVAGRIKCGLVSVNTFRPILPSLPYGGYKMSGLGRENGLEVLEAYTETKAVVIDLSVDLPSDPFGT